MIIIEGLKRSRELLKGLPPCWKKERVNDQVRMEAPGARDRIDIRNSGLIAGTKRVFLLFMMMEACRQRSQPRFQWLKFDDASLRGVVENVERRCIASDVRLIP